MNRYKKLKIFVCIILVLFGFFVYYGLKEQQKKEKIAQLREENFQLIDEIDKKMDEIMRLMDIKINETNATVNNF
jgi:Tfp pilus assembly protein PilO